LHFAFKFFILFIEETKAHSIVIHHI
jgi:hypothetical protein